MKKELELKRLSKLKGTYTASLNNVDFYEWAGEKELLIVINGEIDSALLLVKDETGRICVALDSSSFSKITEDYFFFGPIGSGLQFYYKTTPKGLKTIFAPFGSCIKIDFVKSGPPLDKSQYSLDWSIPKQKAKDSNHAQQGTR